MCYLPISCLRGIITIGSLFTIAVSIGILVGNILFILSCYRR